MNNSPVPQMDKVKFIKTLLTWSKVYGVSLDDIHVSHGGSMLMLGLRDKTGDIDLTVTQDIFDDFERRGYQKHSIGNNEFLISVNPVIDIHTSLSEKDKPSNSLIEDKTGIWYRDAAQTLADYQSLNRPKDQIWIEMLTQLTG